MSSVGDRSAPGIDFKHRRNFHCRVRLNFSAVDLFERIRVLSIASAADQPSPLESSAGLFSSGFGVFSGEAGVSMVAVAAVGAGVAGADAAN